MSQHKIRMLVASLSIITVSTANAITTTLTTNFFQNNGTPTASSPWFTSGVNGTPAAFTTSKDVNNSPYVKSIIFGPSASLQAGTGTTTTVNGSWSVTGNSTADDLAGPWMGGDGIPTGITVKFNTQITFSVGADSPAGSVLTLSATNASNGLGITQTPNSGGQLDPGESLNVSDVSISNLTFTGSVAGYNFTNLNVGNIGAYAVRSANDGNVDGFDELTKVAGLYSVPADPSGKPTIGFGGATSGSAGEGVTASHVAISNGFDTNPGTNGQSNQFFFTGPWTFKMLTGSIALKGIGYKYDVSYSISPVSTGPLTGDYDGNGVVDTNDYVLWRNGDPRADANMDTLVDQTDYDIWRANFGNTSAGSGAGSGLGSAAVPEPATVGLMLVGLVMACLRRNSR